MATYRTAIVLQGGGALGAYEYGALKAFYEKRSKDLQHTTGNPHATFKPDVVTGISIGAITAAILGGVEKDDPLEVLKEVWRERFVVTPPLLPPFDLLYQHVTPVLFQQALAAFGNPGMYKLSRRR
jgi:NTE family protein